MLPSLLHDMKLAVLTLKRPQMPKCLAENTAQRLHANATCVRERITAAVHILTKELVSHDAQHAKNTLLGVPLQPFVSIQIPANYRSADCMVGLHIPCDECFSM